MTNRQENELSTFKGLDQLFSGNVAIIDTYNKLKPLCTLFNENVVKIDDLNARQGVNKSSTTEVKSQDKVALATYVVKASERITAYATFENKPELISQVKVVQSTLEQLADTTLKNTATSVLTIGRDCETDGAPYKLTPAFLDGLEALISTYDVEIPLPVMNIKGRAEITAELKVAFDEQKDVLKRIGVFMKVVAEDHPDLAASFESLKKVIEYGKGKLAVKCLCKDSVTGNGIAKVNVEFALVEGTDLMKSVKRSAPNGGINIDSMPEGPYIVTARKLGYVDNVMNVNVINGELCSIVIVMERVE